MDMNETELFARAILKSNRAERNAFLTEACRGDSALRRQLDALLDAYDDPDSYLAAPRDDQSPDDDTVDWSHSYGEGRMVGPYKLLQRIGEGGMGMVYMAEQLQPVKRRVALKIIKPGMDSRRVIARFEAERQALALMDHPNIARVLDAGTTSTGHPFFVMELVHGLPITEYCDQEQLPTKDRIRLFVDVCRAVQHAHQKGIIHRDLKPSNILVAEYDEHPMPKVIDFGVAKAVGQQLTDKTLFTEFGQVIGTLEYMSPEQAKRNQLDVDTRSDIYSLGIVLYTLLTGETPFDANRFKEVAWDELFRIIREDDPPLPSVKLSGSKRLEQIATNRKVAPKRLASVVRGDLDWIVMKSLEKERSRRYDSANALADDLVKHLSNHPISARPPSMVNTVGKWVRRHRSFAISAMTTLLILAAAMWWTLRSSQQKKIKRLAEIQERTAQLHDAIQDGSLALGKAVQTPLGQSAEWSAVDTNKKRIEDLLSAGPVDERGQVKADELLNDMKIAKQDRELADLLESVLLAGATNMNLASWQTMERRIREMFRSNGMDLDTSAPLEIARLIREHPFKARWADALELWIGTRGQMQSMGGPRLTAADMQPWAEAMYAADDDPLRTGIRRQIYSQRLNPVELDKLADSTDLADHSPRTLAWYGVAYESSQAPDKADKIFKLALRLYPQDVMLNYDYALVLSQRKKHDRAVHMYNRCVALRPDIPGLWLSLARELKAAGYDELSSEAKEWADALNQSAEVSDDATQR